jgi:hypothetical protein
LLFGFIVKKTGVGGFEFWGVKLPKIVFFALIRVHGILVKSFFSKMGVIGGSWIKFKFYCTLI